MSKKEHEEYAKLYQKKVESKKKEIQSYIDDVIIPEYNSMVSLKILKCEITGFALGIYQYDIYIYLDIEYTSEDPAYKKQLKQQYQYGQPWRSISTFFSFMRTKFEERYNWENKERIGFNPQSAEYSIPE